MNGYLKTYRFKFLAKSLVLLVLITSSICKAQTNTHQNPLQKNETSANSAFQNNDFDNYFKLYLEWETLVKNSKDSELKIESIYKNGTRFLKLKLYEKSIAISNRILDYNINNSIYQNKKYIYLTYTNISIAYNRLGEHNKALKNYLDCLKKIENIDDLKTQYASTLNNIGLHYLNYKNKPDSALVYFKQSKAILETNALEKEFLYGTVKGNIADIYFNRKQYEDAKELIADNLNLFRTNIPQKVKRITRKRLLTHIALAKINLAQNNFSNANTILTNLDIEIDTLSIDLGRLVPVKRLQTKQELALKSGDLKTAYNFSEQLNTLKDSLHLVSEQQNLTVAKLLEDTAIKKHEIQLANEQLQRDKDQQKSQIRFWVVTLILTIALAIFIILYNRHKQQAIINANKKALAEQKAQAKTLENQLLQQNIENQKKDLSNFAITTKQNKDWLAQLSDLIADLKSKNNVNRNKAIKELDTAIKDKQRINTFTEDLQQQVEHLNTDFYHKLNTDYPSLTPYELKLCSLLRINLETKDIAALLNISPSSVNTSRYRLRKKLQLDKSQNLVELLKSY